MAGSQKNKQPPSQKNKLLFGTVCPAPSDVSVRVGEVLGAPV